MSRDIFLEIAVSQWGSYSQVENHCSRYSRVREVECLLLGVTYLDGLRRQGVMETRILTLGYLAGTLIADDCLRRM